MIRTWLSFWYCEFTSTWGFYLPLSGRKRGGQSALSLGLVNVTVEEESNFSFALLGSWPRHPCLREEEQMHLITCIPPGDGGETKDKLSKKAHATTLKISPAENKDVGGGESVTGGQQVKHCERCFKRSELR